MPQTPEEFWSAYESWQEKVDKHFLRSHKSAGIADSHVAAAMVQHSTNNKDLLDTLPWETKKELLAQFRQDVLGIVDDVGLADTWEEIGPGGGGVRVGRYVGPKGSMDPRDFVLRQLSIQRYDEIPVEGHEFKFGANLPRFQYIKSVSDTISSGITIRNGESVVVFDTETLGLTTDDASVRSWSGIKMDMRGGSLSIDPTKAFDEHFNVSRAAYGSVYDQQTQRLVRMDSYIRTRLGGMATNIPGDGTDFVERAVPMLSEMRKAKYIAGHNVSFDISQILGNMIKTRAYQDSEVVGGLNVRTLVDDLGAKIEGGGVLDTLTLAREYFDNSLDLAPEFRRTLQPRMFSLENLMMQTNLTELLRRDLGEDFYQGLASGVQHQADVDTRITGQLLSYLTSGKRELEASVLGASGDAAELAIRRGTLKSYAPTPVSNIADISHMSPTMFGKLYEEALEGKGTLEISRLSTGGVETLREGMADHWYAELNKEASDYVQSSKLTLMEQHIDATRNLHLDVANPDNMAGKLGSWRRYSGIDTPYEGMLNRLHTLFKRGEVPGDEKFLAFQRRMAEAGMPFAGLSLEERILTGALAESGKRRGKVQDFLAGSSEARVAQYGDDLGIGRFAMESQHRIFKSGVTAMPIEVLQAAGIGRFTGDAEPQMLSLSTVKSTKTVNLMYDITEEETNTLMEYLRKNVAVDADTETRKMLQGFNINKSTLGKIEETFIGAETWKRGIAVGKLQGDAGHAAFYGLSDLLQNLTRDKDKIPFRVGFMDFTRNAKGEGIIRTGAAILDRFMSTEDKRRYSSDMKLASKRAATLGEELSTKHGIAAARMAHDYGITGVGQKANAIYDAAKKRLPVIGGLAAVAFGGYYARKKYQEKATYDAPMERMPIEAPDDYADYRREMGMSPAPAIRRPDPLLYAGVTGNLHNGAIGHTNMSNNKNAGLFAGV